MDHSVDDKQPNAHDTDTTTSPPRRQTHRIPTADTAVCTHASGPPAAPVSGAVPPRQGRSLPLASRLFRRGETGRASGLRPPLDSAGLQAPDPFWQLSGGPGNHGQETETQGGVDTLASGESMAAQGHKAIAIASDLHLYLDLDVFVCHTRDIERG